MSAILVEAAFLRFLGCTLIMAALYKATNGGASGSGRAGPGAEASKVWEIEHPSGAAPICLVTNPPLSI